MRFLGTTEFLKSFRKLSNNYSTIKTDVSQEFSGLSFEQIFSKNYVLKDSGIAKIIKIRIANSGQNKGKSAGFRIIVLADSRNQEIVFLNIFAKVGTDGKDNIDKGELRECLDTFKSEKKEGLLAELDSDNLFEIIQPSA